MHTSNTVIPKRKLARPPWSRVAVGLCIIYEAGLLSFLALRGLGAGDYPFLALLGVFLPFLFAPLLLGLPLALWLRSKPAALGAVILAVVFAVLYGPMLIPKRNDALAGADADGVLRIMTFNLGPNQADPRALLAAIRSENADIVAVQELTTDVSRLLEAELDGEYPYSTLEDKYTIALLSRYPIVMSEWFPPQMGGRDILHAVLEWQDMPIRVLVVHPWPPGIQWGWRSLAPVGLSTQLHATEITHIAKLATMWDGPRFVVGDFNMTEQMSVYSELAGILHDAYREAGAGFGFTFPNDVRFNGVSVPGPLIRIDYLFHSDEWMALDASVGCEGSSDHCYLITQLMLAVDE